MSARLDIQNGRVQLTDRDRAFTLEIGALSLQSGQTIALTGASGSGKTLMLEVLGLLRKPADGTQFQFHSSTEQIDLAEVWALGVRSAKLAQCRGRMFGFVPQSGGLMPFLSVEENVALPQRIGGQIDHDWCRRLIGRLGLDDVGKLRPGALSIGQRQRTAIARALAHRPAFVIADEPTAALDPDSADQVLELLLEMAKDQECGVILSSHDLPRMRRFGIPRMELHVTSDNTGSVISRLGGPSC